MLNMSWIDAQLRGHLMLQPGIAAAWVSGLGFRV